MAGKGCLINFIIHRGCVINIIKHPKGFDTWLCKCSVYIAQRENDHIFSIRCNKINCVFKLLIPLLLSFYLLIYFFFVIIRSFCKFDRQPENPRSDGYKPAQIQQSCGK